MPRLPLSTVPLSTAPLPSPCSVVPAVARLTKATAPAALLATALWATAATPALAQVGLMRTELGGVPVHLVYPTAQASRAVAMGPFTVDAALDAVPADGPRRLVVLSHGTGGNPLVDHVLAATLARAGFVVAQPQHAGDNFQDHSRAGPEAFVTRPGEVSRVIDALAAHPQWQARLQLDRVGVHGMSAGGVTALSLAGAQWSTWHLVQHCLAQGEADLGFCYNGLVDPQAQARRRAGYEAARGVPAAQLPEALTQLRGGRTPDTPQADVRPDPRVAAVTLAVPVAAPFTAESLARIRVPVGVVSAQRDTMLLPRFHSDHVLAHCRSCQPLATLTGGGHFDVLAPWPDSVAQAVGRQHARGGFTEPGFDPAERSAAFAAIAAFFVQQLGR